MNSEGSPIVVRPGAKLNLTLEVLGRREDGYHEVVSVFQAIDLSDELTIWPDDLVSLACDRPDLAGEGNLALRAARQLQVEAGVSSGARLHLKKAVPVAAGLGGGSADAAGALVGCARLWGLDWPVERLSDLAAKLGSDCAFFVGALGQAGRRASGTATTALAEGRGEVLTPLPPLPRHWALILRPGLRMPPPADKTRRLYAALRPTDFGSGAGTRALAAALRAGKASELDPTLLANSFERAAQDVFPEIGAARAAMLAAGAGWVRLAGSGPCLYSLFADAREARTVADALRTAGEEVYLARTASGTTED